MARPSIGRSTLRRNRLRKKPPGATVRRLPVLLAAVLAMGSGTSGRAVPSLLGSAVEGEVRRARQEIQDLAVEVVDLVSGDVVFSHRADRSMIPASNQKLFTTAATLDLLGPAWEHETPLLVRGRIDAAGRLQGDLAVRGAGDPNFSGRFENGDPYGTFRRWARALRYQGIRRVQGDLWLADGLFDRQFVHPDWPPEQLMWWYEAPVSALSFSDNCQLLQAWGGRVPGQPAVVELLPRLDSLQIASRLITTASSSAHRWKVHRDAGSRRVEVSGALLRDRAPVQAWVTVEDPLGYFAAGLRAAFLEEGVAILGDTRFETELPAPADAWQTVWVERNLLTTSLEVTNKRSQNLYAENLVKLLGARRCGRGSWPDGTRALAELIEGRLGIPLPDDAVVLADGSGMSRRNRTTARTLTQLLRRMYYHPFGWEFVTSLPYGGEEDASLEKRLDEPPYRGNVFAKTGSLTGVSSLSGYVKGGSGRLYAFSILCQDAAVWRGRKAQDRIVEAIVDHG